MAIPCILNDYDQQKISTHLSQNDIIEQKLSVSCKQWNFYLYFRKQYSDGLCVVELAEGAKMD